MEEASYLREIRDAYDGVADVYAELYGDDGSIGPLDLAMIRTFAELVRGVGPIADVGCGPGHVTAHLSSLGLETFGVDVSPVMIELARKAHPDLRFEEGPLDVLPVRDSSLGGVLSRYSIIHMPPARVPVVLGEFHRVLADEGHLLVSFQGTDHEADAPEEFDHRVTAAHRWPPGLLTRLLREAGFTERARLIREPEPDERFPQVHLLARKPSAGT